MVSPRLRCWCCALPQRVLHHVASRAGAEHQPRLAAHREESEQIRSQRRHEKDAHEPAPLTSAAPAGRSVYDAGHARKLPGKLVRSTADAKAHDPVANQAWDNVGITLDFYRTVFGRDSLDGRGMHVKASVHYGEGFSNAMWTGKEMLFGDGDGIHILGFAQSLDIVAHELTHAVTQHTVKGGLGELHRDGKVQLVGQAGAINESLSDVFASMAKQWHAKEDVRRADWLVGEGVLAPEIGKAVRSLKDPGNPKQTYDADDQAKDMRGYVEGGDVHANSGIPNHAFFLAAHALGGHSWEHVGPVWYRAMPRLTADAGFAQLAKLTQEAAGELFGVSSREQKSVAQAWRDVKVVH